ncbi:MAG: hypothetical protein AAGD01_08445 [Acidobacteriota bacterium]
MKKLATKLAILALLAAPLALVPVTEAPAGQYTLEEVAEACDNAYDRVDQFIACVNNVCGFYGCD